MFAAACVLLALSYFQIEVHGLGMSCGQNQTFSLWASNTKSCDNRQGSPKLFEIRPGCYCKTDYYRDNVSGRCLLIDNCANNQSQPVLITVTQTAFYTESSARAPEALREDVSCPENEEFMCGCRETCESRKANKCVACKDGCYCTVGFVYEGESCVAETTCPKSN